MTMLYTRETSDDIDTVGGRLEDAVKAHQFGVIAVVDLQAKMKDKGVDFENPCRVYEVCNPAKAKEVLESDMSISTALPCRISVYQEGDKVKIATQLPTKTLSLFEVPNLEPIAEEVENAIISMIDAAVV